MVNVLSGYFVLKGQNTLFKKVIKLSFVRHHMVESRGLNGPLLAMYVCYKCLTSTSVSLHSRKGSVQHPPHRSILTQDGLYSMAAVVSSNRIPLAEHDCRCVTAFSPGGTDVVSMSWLISTVLNSGRHKAGFAAGTAAINK